MALAAITIDGDRLGLLAAMPVIVMESGDQGADRSRDCEAERDLYRAVHIRYAL